MTVFGTVNPNGLSTSYVFQYGTTTSYGTTTGTFGIGNASAVLNVSANLAGLSPNTTYHYRIVGTNTAGAANGADATFTTTAAGGIVPTVVTGGIGNLTTNSVTVFGTVNPNGLSTSYVFQHGTTTSYGTTTGTFGIGNASAVLNVSANLAGLSPNTTYHYRIVGTNSAGTANGPDATFTTTSAGGIVPTVATGGIGNLTTNSVTLFGTVNPNGLSTSYVFQYGTTTNYGTTTGTFGIGNASAVLNVSANLAGLSPNTTYHYRIVGVNSAGTTNGSDATFSTGTNSLTLPTVSTGGADGITTTQAILRGTVNPNGSSTSYSFQYGTTSSYGSTSGSSGVGGNSPQAAEMFVGGLAPGTTYHYRIVGTNATGTSFGGNAVFTTAANSTATPPVVTTGSAGNITTTDATVFGTVNPKGGLTTYFFQFGTTTGYGRESGRLEIGSANSALNISGYLPALSTGTLHHYRLVASNGAGTSFGNDATFTTVGASQPGSFTLSGANPSCNGNSPQITLAWTPSSGVVTYEVYRNGSLYSPGVPADTLTFLNTGSNVAAGTTYTYFIRARNAAGTRDSNVLQASAPLNCGGTLPGAFTLTAATPGCSAGNPQITVAWTASSNVTTYELYRNGSLYSPGIPANTLTFLNTGSNVARGTTYTYFVRARNSSGTRDSNSVQATAPNCAP